MSSREEQKRQLREERQERDQRAAHAAARKRRLGILGAVTAAAVAVVVALVLIGGGDSEPSGAGEGESLLGAADTRALFRGIPQNGAVLGKADAPVTLVEYVDLQCPFCAQYATQVAPTLVRDYVRSGKLRIVQRTVPILGPESETAATWSVAAQRRDRLFEFNELFFRNQGQENSGYVTADFLRKVARGAGLDPAAMASAAAELSPPGTGGVSSTPSFRLGRTGATPEPLAVSQLSVDEFTAPIERLLR